MGFMAVLKAQKAYKLHGDGKYEEARKLYEEAIAGGVDQPRFLLPYTTLLIRSGEYATAREMLVKMQKHPALSQDQRTQIFVNYAACVYRLGDIQKGIRLLERQHLHSPCGLIYQTLGCLYVEQFDPSRKKAFLETVRAEAEAKAAKAAQEAAEAAAANNDSQPETNEKEPASDIEPECSPEDLWEQGIVHAEEYIKESIEYDDEDPICLDNMGQFLYRVKGDPASAKSWFEKAHEIKERQIDTLYFLSLYDIESGNNAAAIEKLETALEGRFSPLNYADRDRISTLLEKLKK